MGNNKIKFNKIDGGEPPKTLGKGPPLRGLRARRARAAGVVANAPMPKWMKRDIDDLSQTTGAQGRADQEDVDLRSSFDKRYDIRNIDGEPVAHITPDTFHDVLTKNGKFAEIRSKVSKINISDGRNVDVELVFDRPGIGMGITASTSDVRRYGISGAMKGHNSVTLIGGNGNFLGTITTIQIAPDLDFHANKLHTVPDTVHRSFPDRVYSNLSKLFRRASILKKCMQKNPDGVDLYVPNFENSIVKLGRLFHIQCLMVHIRVRDSIRLRNFITGH